MTEWSKYAPNPHTSAVLEGEFEVSAPTGGFSMNAVNRLLMTFGRPGYGMTVPFALRVHLKEAHTSDSVE